MRHEKSCSQKKVTSDLFIRGSNLISVGHGPSRPWVGLYVKKSYSCNFLKTVGIGFQGVTGLPYLFIQIHSSTVLKVLFRSWPGKSGQRFVTSDPVNSIYNNPDRITNDHIRCQVLFSL